MSTHLTFIDFFAGIGGMRYGFELAGFKPIGFCEKDKFAVKSYKAMFDTGGEWYAEDITKIRTEDIPTADIWAGGFPCTDISVAGKQQGLSGERSGLYFEFTKLLKSKEEKDKPTWVVIENVKNLLSINGGFDFATVLSELDQAGYDSIWQVLNSKDFGVPQNRERVFIIGSLRSRGRREILPLTGENTAALKQIIGGLQAYRVYDTDGISCTLTGCGGGIGAKTGLYAIGNVHPSGKGMNGNVYSPEGISPTLTTNKGEGIKIVDNKEKVPIGFNRVDGVKGEIKTAHTINSSDYKGINRNQTQNAVLEAYPVLTPERKEKRQNGRRMKDIDEPMFTLTSSDKHGVAIKEATKKGYAKAEEGDSINISFPNSKTRRGRIGKGIAKTLDTSCMQGTLGEDLRIRRLTPKECFRLQGFPDELFEKAREINSDSQLYKQAGNAVTVNVAYAIAISIKDAEMT